jgi:hypothetical protein
MSAAEMTPRRRLFYLMRREKKLAQRIAAARLAGAIPHFVAAECSSIAWAIGELSRLYPVPAANARQDLERELRGRHGGQRPA